jgi:hypothetical protein
LLVASNRTNCRIDRSLQKFQPVADNHFSVAITLPFVIEFLSTQRMGVWANLARQPWKSPAAVVVVEDTVGRIAADRELPMNRLSIATPETGSLPCRA